MEKISLAAAIAILEQKRLNTPKMIRRVAIGVVTQVTREAMRNVNNSVLNVRTGSLKRYISTTLQARHEGPRSISIGLPKGEPEAIIARVQNDGGTIRPSQHQYLRVPLPDALTENLVDREVGRHFCTDPYYQGQKIRLLKSKSGNLILFIKDTHGEILPLYVLKESVTLPPRPWWTTAVKTVREKLPQITKASISALLSGRNGRSIDMETAE